MKNPTIIIDIFKYFFKSRLINLSKYKKNYVPHLAPHDVQI